MDIDTYDLVHQLWHLHLYFGEHGGRPYKCWARQTQGFHTIFVDCENDATTDLSLVCEECGPIERMICFDCLAALLRLSVDHPNYLHCGAGHAGLGLIEARARA